MKDGQGAREVATLAGIEDLLKTTEAAIADCGDDPPDQASAVATVGVLGAVAHVASNLAVATDRLASIDASLKEIAVALKPTLIVERVEDPDESRRRIGRERVIAADLVIAPDGSVRKDKYGDARDAVEFRVDGNVTFVEHALRRGMLVYFAREEDLA